jgi:hypothetical protein
LKLPTWCDISERISGLSVATLKSGQYQQSKTGAAFGIGRNGDTSPRLGCCQVAECCCGGNLFEVWWLTAKGLLTVASGVTCGFRSGNLLKAQGETWNRHPDALRRV